MGPAPAAYVERGARLLLRFGRRAADSLSYSAGEYLREEARTAPGPHEVRRFIARVDELRDACAGLEARLNRLARR